MTGFGKLLLGLGVLLLAGFLTLVRWSPSEKPAVANAPPPPPSGPGELVLPVAGVQADQLVASFGDERAGGARGHGAIDIAAPRGTPVLAAEAGTIEKLFESRDGGYTIYVRSPDGRRIHYYAHLDTYAPGIREGIAVSRGERIAAVGSTGDANPAGPHLHFEVKEMAPGEKWYEGRAIDPYPLLAGKLASR